jgi:hypothetical protein
LCGVCDVLLWVLGDVSRLERVIIAFVCERIGGEWREVDVPMCRIGHVDPGVLLVYGFRPPGVVGLVGMGGRFVLVVVVFTVVLGVGSVTTNVCAV